MILREIGVLWGREVTQFVRRPARMLGLVMQPLIWLVLFGIGLKKAFNITVEGFDYIVYIVPGILAMNILYSASRGGMSVLRDSQLGFLKEVLVAPVARVSILLGVGLGIATRSVIQGAFLLAVAYTMGYRLGGSVPEAATRLLLLVLLMYVVSLALVSLAIAVAWKMEDMQEYAITSNFLVFPLFLLSGAVYPISRMDPWMEVAMRANPMAHAVDAFRHVGLPGFRGEFELWLDVVVLLGLLLGGLGFGSAVMRQSVEEG